MAKQKATSKKRNVRVDAIGQLHVHSSFNNIIVSLANNEGQIISWSSAGKMGFRGSKKNTPYAAQMAAEDCAKVAFDLGLRKVKAYVKGPGNGRESAIRAIHGAGIEVTEIVDGSCLVRIKPLSKEQREMSERCVQGLGYQGNNLLCSNWDTDHMEKLDYNGIYEYLYAMKHQKAFDAEDYSNGIPKEEFESLIMEYLPVTAEQIQEYAVFDEKNQTYVWVRLGCLNYAPTFFGTSLPEVIDIKENEDGTVTLTVDAVCDMVICDDAVITHELTVKFADDGSFQYLGNEILDDGIMHIPDYQYRIKE